MSRFGYLCRGCNTGIRAGERVLLRHIRHGKVVGDAAGVYDGHGRVEGKPEFRHQGAPGYPPVNSMAELVRSQHQLKDSGTRSGIQAWHQLCWVESGANRKDVSISASDPRQAGGRARPRFRALVMMPMAHDVPPKGKRLPTYERLSLSQRVRYLNRIIDEIVAQVDPKVKDWVLREVIVNYLLASDEEIDMLAQVGEILDQHEPFARLIYPDRLLAEHGVVEAPTAEER